jgi:hypothetical protein
MSGDRVLSGRLRAARFILLAAAVVLAVFVTLSIAQALAAPCAVPARSA